MFCSVCPEIAADLDIDDILNRIIGRGDRRSLYLSLVA